MLKLFDIESMFKFCLPVSEITMLQMLSKNVFYDIFLDIIDLLSFFNFLLD